MDKVRALQVLSQGLFAILNLCQAISLGPSQSSNMEQLDMENYQYPPCNPTCGLLAICSASKLCMCQVNYSFVNGTCQPICDMDCGKNGFCSEPNKCACFEGYKWDNKQLSCQPLCHPQCGKNGICIAPNTCDCYQGYSFVNDTCQPVCQHDCGSHGFCMAPEQCGCTIGYEWDKKSARCMPKCNPKCGLHSYCAKTNHCKCNKGFKPNDLLSLSCSLSMEWWVYLLIGLMCVTIFCSGAGIIFCYLKRRSNVSYYPNTNFSDTDRIIQ